MKTQSVLIEKSDIASRKNVITASGLLLEERYVITTSNVLNNFFTKSDLQYFQQLNSGTLYLCPAGTKFDEGLHIVWKNDNENIFTVKKATVFVIFKCDNIQNTPRSVFRDWSIDTCDNSSDIKDILSLYFILKIEDSGGSFKDFKEVLNSWWASVSCTQLDKGDDVLCTSSAFGNRQFLNTSSRGIVSNFFGKNSCLFLSDCPTTPGSEGSPIYVAEGRQNQENRNIPIGLVISSSIWWQKGWVGLTLMVDIRSMLLQIVDVPVKIENFVTEKPNFKLLAATEYSIVQVYSGGLKGTAILLSKEKGIFITNSHVIREDEIEATLKWRNEEFSGTVVYTSSMNDAFDLAVIKCNCDIIQKLELQPCKVQHNKQYKTGDTSYTAGFSLLSRDSNPTPVLCKGYISGGNKYMMKTTSAVHPGASGGAVLDQQGTLLAIIVCNIMLEDKRVFPRFTIAIPIGAVWDGLNKYLISEDIHILKELTQGDRLAQVTWSHLEGKL